MYVHLEFGFIWTTATMDIPSSLTRQRRWPQVFTFSGDNSGSVEVIGILEHLHFISLHYETIWSKYPLCCRSQVEDEFSGVPYCFRYCVCHVSYFKQECTEQMIFHKHMDIEC